MPSNMTWNSKQKDVPQFGPPCKGRYSRTGGVRFKSRKNGGSPGLWRYIASKQIYTTRSLKQYYLSDKPLDYDEFLKSPYWLRLRKEVLKQRNKCEDCGYTKRLQLHHQYYYRFGRSVLYHERDFPDIFVVLCNDCHMKRHSV